MTGRIMRQADQWLLGADEDQPDDTANKVAPPRGTEDFLKGPAIMPELNKVMNNPGPGATDGTPERWPAELPGDKVLQGLDHVKHDVIRALPVAKAAKPSGADQ